MSLESTLERIAQEGKRVLVVGLGACGIECATALARRGILSVIVEKQPEGSCRSRKKFSSQLEMLGQLGVVVHYGVDGELVGTMVGDVGLVSLSPGVSVESAVVGSLKRLGVPLVAEFELRASLEAGQLVVVAGSNGKGTTAALIDHILNVTSSAGVSSDCGLARVLEASSYQLEACASLKPSVSVVLNVNESHLERHGSLERYAAATARAIRSQDIGDYAVINGDDPIVVGMAKSSPVSLGVFGSKAPAELERLSRTWAHISYARSTHGSIDLSLNGALETYETARCALLGAHNRYNIAAAILAARRLGVSPKFIQQGIDSFSPLEHRLEIITVDSARTFINDSKSTTVAATVAALKAVRDRYPDAEISLLIGGLSKAGSWGALLSSITRNTGPLLRLICFGEDGRLLASHCRAHSVVPVVFESLKEATVFACRETRAGGVILLSPGCSSFDEFTDFAHRGEEFKRYARGEGVPEVGEMCV